MSNIIKNIFLVAFVLIVFSFGIVNAWVPQCSGNTYDFICGDIVDESCIMNGNLTSIGTCFTVYADNIVIDCDGYTITGSQTGYGVLNDGYDNVSINGCIIHDFTVGIQFYDSTIGLIYNNTVYDNNNGITLDNSSLINVSGNDVYGHDYGISLIDGSNNNTVADNSVNGNDFGIYLTISPGNNLTNNFVCRNSEVDVYDNEFPNNNWARTIYSSSDPNNSTYFAQVGDCSFEQGVCGQFINEDIVLTEDIECTEEGIGDSGIVVEADNITIDCNGYSIIGFMGSGIGVEVSGYDGITIINCNVSNFLTGIYVEDSIGTEVYDSIIYYNGMLGPDMTGIHFYNVNYSAIYNNLVHENDIGIVLEDSYENEVYENEVYDNLFQGIHLVNSEHNVIYDNHIYWNADIGLYILNSTNNLFENNTVCTNRLSDILFRGTSEGNEGDNTCNVLDDTEEDMNMEVTCSITCPYYGNCGDEIDGDIVLARDIEDCEDGLIVTTDNIVIDCNGYRIYGDGINGGIGILVDSLDNITIKNCTIKYFGVGIALFNSNSSTLMSNYMDSNGMGGETGIYMFNSNYTTVENNLVENDDGTGINLEFGFLNTLTNNTLLNNLYGIYLISSHNNTLTDNTANENVFGIDLGNSANNTLSGNTANKNIVVGVYLTGTSTNNYLIENTVNQNIGETYGILLSEGADENTLINNTIIGNTAGMNVGSLNNTLIDNFACANIVDIIDYTDGNDWTRTTYTFSDPVNTTYFDQLATCPFIQGLCGQTVTESVTLTEDIVCEEGDIFSPRPTALVIGANNLTIDCDGNYLIGYADYAGILSSGYNNTEIINCDISGFFYGIYFEDSNNSIVEDSNLHENMCEGMYIYSSSEDPYHAYVYDTVFEDNYQECVLTGLYLSSSTLFMWNSEFINNGEYGLYEEFRGIPDTVYWTIDDYAYCKDNGIYISTADGYITFDEGVLEIDNCTIEIYNRETETWAIWSIEGNMTDYIPEREVEANESEEFVFENSDAIITLELNETTNISFFVGLLNAGQLEALGDSPTGLIPFKGINVEINENEINGTITICITYTDDELDDAGIEEDTLVMYYFNETSDEWEIITLQRQGSNRVCAEIPHFSIYALFGEKTEEDGGSPRGSSYTGGGARPVGQSPITTEEEEEELQIDEEELEEEIIVPEKPSEEIPDEKPIDTTKPYVPPTIEEQQEESDFTGIYIVAGIIIIAGIIYWWMTAAKAGKKGLMRFK